MIDAQYLVIEGNIGAGKTSFAKKFAEQNNARLILEQFATNPFLPKFYENAAQYAFPLELSFLAERFQQLKDQLLEPDLFSKFAVADYLFQKCLIFAQVNLPPEEFSLFSTFFSVMHTFLPKPDLIIYLHQDIARLKSNIKKRGRVYEQSISDEYLINVEKGYFNYFKQFPNQKVLIFDVTSMDFVNNNDDFNRIRDKIILPKVDGIYRFF